MRPKTTYKIDLNMQDLAALQHRQGHWEYSTRDYIWTVNNKKRKNA